MKKLLLLVVTLLGVALPHFCLAGSLVPTLTTPRSSLVGANQATLILKASSASTGYVTLLSGSGAPCGTGTQIKAGLSAGGVAAPYHGSLPLFANISAHYTVRNLTQATPYTVCFTAGNITLQETPATTNVTTIAAATRTSPAWGSLGAAGFSAGQADYTSLAFAPDGTPYVAYSNSSGFVTVKKFNSNGYTWDDVGSPGFSTDVASYTSLAFAPNGTPYVAYQDATNNATVMMFNGTSWSTVGSIGSGVTSYVSLAFAPDGTPYVAYQNNGGSAAVMKFSGGSWSAAGTGLTGIATYPSLAIAPDGTMYLTYKSDDGQTNYAVAVQKLGPTSLSWSPLTTPASSDQYSYITSAIAPDGTLYIAFQDNNHNGATVKRYDNIAASWSTVGSAGLSAGTVSFTSLAFSSDGIPHLAYQDGASGPATVMKFKNGTTTAVSSSAWASPADQQVTYTATVSPSDATGTVDFYFDGVNKETVALVNGTATSSFVTTGYNTGSYPVYAVYNDNGDPNYNGSTSPSRSQSLDASTSFVILISSDKTLTNYGDPITFTVKVNKPDATGTLLIKDGTTQIYQTTLIAANNGTATFSTSTLKAGVHSVYATIDPNQDGYQPLKTSDPIALTINAIPTTAVLALNSGSVTPSNHGASVTFKATITPSNASGKVVFYDGATALNASGATVTAGVATYATTALTPGNHTITAVFTDSVGNFITSTSGAITQSVLTKVVVTTTPTGKSYTVDGGASLSVATTFWWPVGESHTINVATSQQAGATGYRYDYKSWSDGGAQSHSVTTPGTDTTYTAAFETEYLVTPQLKVGSTVTPASGTTIPAVATWYPAGSTPSFIATAAAGYDFVSWSGAAATPASAATTLTALTGPVTLTANMATVSLTLSASVPTKVAGTGAGVRNWTINLTNSGATQVTSAKITSIVFSSGTSSACQPATVAATPINVTAGTGTILAGATGATAAIPINFGTCPKLTKFNVSINYSATGGGTGTTNLTGQVQ